MDNFRVDAVAAGDISHRPARDRAGRARARARRSGAWRLEESRRCVPARERRSSPRPSRTPSSLLPLRGVLARRLPSSPCSPTPSSRASRSRCGNGFVVADAARARADAASRCRRATFRSSSQPAIVVGQAAGVRARDASARASGRSSSSTPRISLGPALVLSLGGARASELERRADLRRQPSRRSSSSTSSRTRSGRGISLGHRPSRSGARDARCRCSSTARSRPVGLAVAIASRGRSGGSLAVLPLVWLLHVFAQERQRRLDHARRALERVSRDGDAARRDDRGGRRVHGQPQPRRGRPRPRRVRQARSRCSARAVTRSSPRFCTTSAR